MAKARAEAETRAKAEAEAKALAEEHKEQRKLEKMRKLEAERRQQAPASALAPLANKAALAAAIQGKAKARAEVGQQLQSGLALARERQQHQVISKEKQQQMAALTKNQKHIALEIANKPAARASASAPAAAEASLGARNPFTKVSEQDLMALALEDSLRTAQQETALREVGGAAARLQAVIKRYLLGTRIEVLVDAAAKMSAARYELRMWARKKRDSKEEGYECCYCQEKFDYVERIPMTAPCSQMPLCEKCCVRYGQEVADAIRAKEALANLEAGAAAAAAAAKASKTVAEAFGAAAGAGGGAGAAAMAAAKETQACAEAMEAAVKAHRKRAVPNCFCGLAHFNPAMWKTAL